VVDGKSNAACISTLFLQSGSNMFGIANPEQRKLVASFLSMPLPANLPTFQPTNPPTQKKLKAETFSFVGGTYHPPMYRVLPLLLMY